MVRKGFWKKQSGGPALESVLVLGLVVLSIASVIDVSLGFVSANSLHHAAMQAGEQFSRSRSVIEAKRAANEALPAFLRRCLNVEIFGKDQQQAFYVQNASWGSPLDSGTTYANLVLGKVQVKCAWTWLTPGMRVWSQNFAEFQSVQVVALESETHYTPYNYPPTDLSVSDVIMIRARKQDTAPTSFSVYLESTEMMSSKPFTNDPLVDAQEILVLKFQQPTGARTLRLQAAGGALALESFQYNGSFLTTTAVATPQGQQWTVMLPVRN